MDNNEARKELTKLRDSLNEVLGAKGNSLSKADAEKAVKEAKKGVKRLKKSLLERVKDLPVVNQATQLGAAGSVAVATAAVTQTNIAVEETEVLVASVANDVVENRFKPPSFIDRFVDFSEVNAWGQKVMQQKVEATKQEVARQEAKIAPTKADAKPNDSKPTSDKQNDTQAVIEDKSKGNNDKQSDSKQLQGADKKTEPNKSAEEKDKQDAPVDPKPQPVKESNNDAARIEEPEIILEFTEDDTNNGLKPGSNLINTPIDIIPNSPSSSK